MVVTTPQEVALIDARKAIGLFERVETPILGIIEKTHTVISKSIGKRTFIKHSDDLGNQRCDHQE